MGKYRFYIHPWKTGKESGLDLSGNCLRLQVQDRAGQVFQQNGAPPSATMSCCSGSRLEGGAWGESFWARGSRNIFLELVVSGTLPGMCHQQPHGMSAENCQAQFFDLHFSCYHITYNPPQESHIKTEQDQHTHTKKKNHLQASASPMSLSWSE